MGLNDLNNWEVKQNDHHFYNISDFYSDSTHAYQVISSQKHELITKYLIHPHLFRVKEQVVTFQVPTHYGEKNFINKNGIANKK